MKLKPVIDVIPNIISYGSNDKSTSFRLGDLIPLSLENYYRYSGSLTTPGCDEIVEWIVIDSPVLTMSDEQLLDFQSLQDSHGFPVK